MLLNAPLAPYRFDLIITGLCLFVLDPLGATVILVNASNPKRFESDLDMKDIEPFIPHPHFPRFGYLMSQQIRQGVVHRLPDRVFAGPTGDEVAVCDLEGEDLLLLPSDPIPFQPGPLAAVPKLSSILPVTLSSLSSAPIPNFAVAARFRLNNGALDTLRVGFAGLNPLQVDLRTINTVDTASGTPPRTIADQLVLRCENLTQPVEIHSSSSPSILLRPDFDASGNLRPVVASLANFHQEFFQPLKAAFDFLWFYELVDFTAPGGRPSRRDLPIPVYTNGVGGFTGTSAVCPPIHF